MCDNRDLPEVYRDTIAYVQASARDDLEALQVIAANTCAECMRDNLAGLAVMLLTHNGRRPDALHAWADTVRAGLPAT